MGDVGKFAAMLSSKTPDVTTRIISMAAGKEEGGGDWIDAEVTDAELAANLTADFKSLSVQHIDVDANDMQTKLDAAIVGVDAVIACISSRQTKYSRWLTTGTTGVIKAMEKAGVKRLVQLSSMGIGEDFMPFRGVRLLWAGMLRTVFRSVFRDFTGMENVVLNSGLDYLLVRPAALTPSEPPRGSWKLLTSRADGGLAVSVAKSDVAAFMVQEAVTPTFIRTAVTIGQPV